MSCAALGDGSGVIAETGRGTTTDTVGVSAGCEVVPAVVVVVADGATVVVVVDVVVVVVADGATVMVVVDVVVGVVADGATVVVVEDVVVELSLLGTMVVGAAASGGGAVALSDF